MNGADSYRISERVAEHWRFGFGENGEAVVADGQRRLDDAVQLWGLTDLVPLGESYWGSAFSCSAGDRTPVVLKINPRTPTVGGGWENDHACEPLAVQFWAARGNLAPEVYGRAHSNSTYLMEHCQPGTTLRTSRLSALEVTITLGKLARHMHALYRPDDRDQLDAPHISRSPEASKWRLSVAGTREASALEALMAANDEDTLLHLDLHADNVIEGLRGWQVIDPIPVIGDRHAEVYALMFHPAFLESIPSGQIAARRHVETHLAAYCDFADLDFDRAATWLRIRLMYRIWRAERENDEEDQSWVCALPRVVELLPEYALT
jgi:streptomycin 6-kinase